MSPDEINLGAAGADWLANGAGTTTVRVVEGGRVLQTLDVGRHSFACPFSDGDDPALYAIIGDPFGPDIAERDNEQIVPVAVDTLGTGSP